MRLTTKTYTQDYQAFGSVMAGRCFSNANYRFGFNGMEKDNETFTDAYDFGARILDTRIGRWLALDPLRYINPGLSNYNFGLNSPLVFADNEGKDIIVTTIKDINEILEILNSAFGLKAKNDFSFCTYNDDFGKLRYKLQFTGIISDYKRRKEKRVFQPFIDIVNNEKIQVIVYFQKEFLESDIEKVKSGGGDATNTDKTGGEGLIAKDRQKNDYSTSNLYIDPEEYVAFYTGRYIPVEEYKDANGIWTTDQSRANQFNYESRTTYIREKIETFKYSRFFHGIGHVIGGKHNPAQAEKLEFKANRIHKVINNKGNFEIEEILSRDRDYKSHPSGKDYTLYQPEHKSKPLKTLADIWDEE